MVFIACAIANIGVLAYVAAKGTSYTKIFREWCTCNVNSGVFDAETECDADPKGPTDFAKNGILSLLGKYPGVIALAIGLTALLSVGWVFMLKRFARFVCWATVVIKLATLCYFGYWFCDHGMQEQGYVWFALAAFAGALSYYYRQKIELAAEVLRQAATALNENPSTFVAAAIIQLGMLLYLVLFVLATIGLPGVGNWVPVTMGQEALPCVWESAGWMSSGRIFCVIMFYWVMGFFAMLRLFTVSGATGLWFFHQNDQSPDKPKYFGFAALKWGLTNGFGTNACGAIIVGLLQWVKDRAKNPRTPWGCIAYAAVSCFANMFLFVTRFALVMAALYNSTFWEGGKLSVNLMQKHFVGGFVSTTVSKNVLSLGAYIFSILVGFTAWFTICMWEKEDPMEGLSTWGRILYVLYLLGHFYPTFTLFILAVFLAPIGDALGWGWVYGAFCGLVSHILFKYMAHVFLDTSDAVFACLAVDRENGLTSPVSSTIVMALKNQNCPEFLEWQVGQAGAATYVNMPPQEGGAAYAQQPSAPLYSPPAGTMVMAPGPVYAHPVPQYQQFPAGVPAQGYGAVAPGAGQQRGMYPNM